MHKDYYSTNYTKGHFSCQNLSKYLYIQTYDTHYYGVSNSTRYEDMKVDAKCRKRGGLG